MKRRKKETQSMKWHDFVFSKEPFFRFRRHLLFWLSWWVFFIISNFAIPHFNTQLRVLEYMPFTSINLIQSLLVLFIQMVSCYIVIYFLLPRFLMKAKYLLFFGAIILLGSTMIVATFFINTTVMEFVQGSVFQTRPVWHRTEYWASVADGGINSIKIIVAAVAISLGKSSWLKQREKQRLEKEKVETELQLLKAQIHPTFLFNTLNNIYSSALASSSKAPEMLLKLSDLLSYMLYECGGPDVSLAKELKMVEDYMSLEKIRFGENLEMNILIKDSNVEEKIAPLLLLHFIENSFKQCSDPMTEQPWINLEINVINHVLEMKLMNGKPPQTDAEEQLNQVKRRLHLLYSGTHELTIAEEPDIMMINLELKLESLTKKKEPLINELSTAFSQHPLLVSET